MWQIHWRAPLQTKGFLKIIELLVAILAFSLVAGFHTNGRISCVGEDTDTYTISTKYPFRSYTANNVTGASGPVTEPFQNRIVAGQLFVAWGVLTMFYCGIALAVYMLFTANEQLEKIVDFLIYTDLAFNCCWVLCWFIASIEWAVSYNSLRSTIKGLLADLARDHCGSDTLTNPPTQDTYVQAAIAVVFGFLCVFLWAANIYWVVIDTAFFIRWRANRNAPSGY